MKVRGKIQTEHVNIERGKFENKISLAHVAAIVMKLSLVQALGIESKLAQTEASALLQSHEILAAINLDEDNGSKGVLKIPVQKKKVEGLS